MLNYWHTGTLTGPCAFPITPSLAVNRFIITCLTRAAVLYMLQYNKCRFTHWKKCLTQQSVWVMRSIKSKNCFDVVLCSVGAEGAQETQWDRVREGDRWGDFWRAEVSGLAQRVAPGCTRFCPDLVTSCEKRACTAFPPPVPSMCSILTDMAWWKFTGCQTPFLNRCIGDLKPTVG